MALAFALTWCAGGLLAGLGVWLEAIWLQQVAFVLMLPMHAACACAAIQGLRESYTMLRNTRRAR